MALRLRRGDSGIVLHEVLAQQLERLNPGVMDSVRAKEVIRRLTSGHPSIEGNLQAWEYLKGLKTVFVDTERREQRQAPLIRIPQRQTPLPRTGFASPAG